MTASTAPGRNARDRAAEVLTTCYLGDPFCSEVLEAMQKAAPLPPAEASLAAELVIGVSRHRITAEHLAGRFYRGRFAGLRPSVRVILATAIYQLCWLDRIPDYAAVDEAVRQAKRHGRGVSSMVNAVLRALISHRGEISARPDKPDPRRYLAIDAGRGRLFTENVFPDPARRPLDYLVAATSHPPWLVERWHRRFKPKLCRQVCDAGQRRPPLVLRPNTMRITAEQLVERFRASGHQPCRVDDGEAVLLRDIVPAAELAEVQAGLCQPQDSTSQLALRLCPPQAGELVVDLCAGVGTKSTQAAEMMNNSGVVIASDMDEARLGRIPASAERLGLTIIRPTPLEQLDACLAELGRAPDLILVDAPCTNTGVLARRPEARYRASQRALKELTVTQGRLLERAAKLAGPRTRLIYATCSLEREENEEQISRFCELLPQWQVQTQVFTLPDADRDGGFAAVLMQV
ncbi:MAG TPA: transcription antitermination factor NusB [Phycisphaerae bacterium]|nr:transcription antitermination factor NusB [Phycisphaerae bacterium]